MALTCQTDSRIADANRAWQAACNVDVTGWSKANEFIISTWGLSGLKNDDADFKLQWRRAGGTFADVGADTEICWGTTTVLIDAGNLLSANSAGCLATWDSGTENEGDNTSYASNIALGEYWEGQWALGFGSGALDNQEYEIQLVCVTYSNSAICQTSIATAAGVTVEALASVSAGVATVSGAIAVARAVSGASAGVGGVSGAIAVSRALAGTSTVTATVSGALSRSRPLAGVIAGVAGVSGSLARSRPLAAISAGVASVSGAILRNRGLTGVVSGVASVSGAMRVSRALAGISDGAASVSGALNCIRGLSGISDGIAAVTGGLSVEGGDEFRGSVLRFIGSIRGRG